MSDSVLGVVRGEFHLYGEEWCADILADLFGVARYDEMGHQREFGYFSYNRHFATLWLIRVHPDVFVTAHYNITLVSSSGGINTYIIHPLPDLREAIYDRTIYPPRPILVNGHELHDAAPIGWTLHEYADNWVYSDFYDSSQ
jgi:hypothetical protein